MRQVDSNDSAVNIDKSENIVAFLQRSFLCYIKSLFDCVIKKCIALKNQLAHLLSRIIHFDPWSKIRCIRTLLRRRVEVLVAKKDCLKKILKNKREAKTLLRDFNNFVKQKDEERCKTVKDLCKNATKFQEDLCKNDTEFQKGLCKNATKFLKDLCKNATKFQKDLDGERFCDKNDEKTEEEKENIIKRKKWASGVIRFENMTKEITRIAHCKFQLETNILSGKELYNASKRNDLKKELKKAKMKAQAYYNKYLRKEFIKFKQYYGTEDYKIFDVEIEFREALIKFLELDKDNTYKVELGHKAALNISATKYDLNADIDIWLFTKYCEHLKDELIKAKIQEIEEEIKTINAKFSI